MIDLAEIQKRVVKNKVAKGFNTSNMDMEFCLTYGELAEAYEKFSKHKPVADVGEELIDVIIYILGMLELWGLDGEAILNHKLDVNDSRVYNGPPGHKARVEQ